MYDFIAFLYGSQLQKVETLIGISGIGLILLIILCILTVNFICYCFVKIFIIFTFHSLTLFFLIPANTRFVAVFKITLHYLFHKNIRIKTHAISHINKVKMAQFTSANHAIMLKFITDLFFLFRFVVVVYILHCLFLCHKALRKFRVPTTRISLTGYSAVLYNDATNFVA